MRRRAAARTRRRADAMTAGRLELRVYYEDVDLGGVVYYANYLKYFERGRSELLRARGLDQARMLAEQGLGFVVRRIAVEYLSPARFDDHLAVETRVTALKPVSAEIQQAVRRVHDGLDARALATAAVTVALIGRDGRPKRLPPEAAAALAP